ARPLDGLPGSEALAHRLEKRAVRKDLRMAVHARLGGRNAREGGILDRRVAIAAVDAVARNVPLVAELNRLFARNVRFGDPGRSVDRAEQPAEAGDEKHRAEDANASNRVGGTMKDLRHRSKRSGARRRKRSAAVAHARRSAKPFELTAISNPGGRFLRCEVFHVAVKNAS